MKSFQKATKFIKSKFSTKKEVVEPTREVNEEISKFIISKLCDQVKEPNSIPADLTKKQWRLALSSMMYAWEESYKNTHFKSERKNKTRKLKIAIGFKLFIKYFKDIK